MERRKKIHLEKKGWKVGTVRELLELTDAESTYFEIKLRLSEHIRQGRKRKGLTQVQLAELVESSQSRVAKMEGGDPSVSIDLLIRTLLALGVTEQELGKVIAAT
ncbi:MAG: helix-turn-helix domain-containing protein [Deltaproteobacteria bacterium]|nr:helix-turn-helix domain-containing protein [Deltaproteobacteria bacterium]